MSDAQNHPDHDGPHEGPIRTPKQLILAVFFAFVVPIIVIVLLVVYVTSASRPGAGSDRMKPQDVAERIQPIGIVQVKDASDPSTLKAGDQVYAAQCASCHAAGLVGAPKLGDAAAWTPRLKTGYEALLHSALVGKGNMGAQGGGDYTDLEIGRAVVYMANQSGGKFEEPKPSAAGASAPSATTAAAAPVSAAITAAAAAPASAPMATAAATPQASAAVSAAPATAVAGAAPAKPAAAGAVPALYGQVCQACHIAGVAGAPKLGDKAAWAPRLAAGIDGMTASVIKGKGAMPPKGGSSASEEEIKTVVEYMVGTVQ